MIQSFFGSFIQIYYNLWRTLRLNPVTNAPRGLSVAYELHPVVLCIDVMSGAQCFSHKQHRVVPIHFLLAELLWILSGSNDAKMITSYNKSMIHFSDDGVTLYGAYGKRIYEQISICIDMLCADPSTRRAVVSIYDSEDTGKDTKDVPCNVLLQFLIRNECVNLYIISRSSDFVTGLSIDAVHWQILLMLVVNELNYCGQHVNCGYVYYTIHSLHVYTQDKDIVNAWEDIPNSTLEYMSESETFKVGGRYRKVKTCAEEQFTNHLSLMELMHMLTIKEEHRQIMTKYSTLFLTHRNKINR